VARSAIRAAPAIRGKRLAFSGVGEGAGASATDCRWDEELAEATARDGVSCGSLESFVDGMAESFGSRAGSTAERPESVSRLRRLSSERMSEACW